MRLSLSVIFGVHDQPMKLAWAIQSLKSGKSMKKLGPLGPLGSWMEVLENAFVEKSRPAAFDKRIQKLDRLCSGFTELST